MQTQYERLHSITGARLLVRGPDISQHQIRTNSGRSGNLAGAVSLEIDVTERMHRVDQVIQLIGFVGWARRI